MIYMRKCTILATSMHNFTEAIVTTCITVYDQITQELLPTPAKSHYTFNLRDLAKVFQGMLMGDSTKITVSEFKKMYNYFITVMTLNTVCLMPISHIFLTKNMTTLLRLWYHENQRVFADRLINDEDRNYFSELLKSQINSAFNLDFGDVVTKDPLLYGDFMNPNVDNKIYAEIEDDAKVRRIINCLDFILTNTVI